MSIMRPYVVEYTADNGFGGLNSGLIPEQSYETASQLFDVLTASPAVRWARWYCTGEAGDINEYHRPD